MKKFTNEQKIEINQIIEEWLEEARIVVNTSNPSTFINTYGNEVLSHPELIFRRDGKWKGWSDFLNKDPKNTKNILTDTLEDEAWRLLNKEF